MMRSRYSIAMRYGCVLLLAALMITGCGKKKRYLERAQILIEQNDTVDARVAQLPKINAYEDPDYLRKLDGYIATKQQIQRELETLEPTFLLSTTHAKLVQAMKNGIRYLQSEREKYLIAAEKISKNPPSAGDSLEMDIIRDYQSQSAAYQADFKEQLMKQQYEKLYWDAKDELERAAKF